jgi:16S rRNA G1207 methylase RsmC
LPLGVEKFMQFTPENIHIENAIGVCSVLEDTRLLAQIAAQGSPLRGLDLGTGTGFVAIYLALAGCNMDAVDLSMRALNAARHNGRLNQVAINFFQSDLFSAVQGHYDIIACNPPMRGNETENSRFLTTTLRRIAPLRLLLMRITQPFLKRKRLDFLIKIIRGAQLHLNEDGRLCMVLFTFEINELPKIIPELVCRDSLPVLSLPGLNIVTFIFRKNAKGEGQTS